MTDPSEDARIVVDDDYKSQVEREKEDLKKQMDQNVNTDGQQEMPEASFPMLMTTLATQALASLGQIPDPVEGKMVIRKPVAKHFIDTLSILEEKTKGNLSDEENEMLSMTLHQLRMLFVSTPDEMPDGEPEKPASKLELPD